VIFLGVGEKRGEAEEKRGSARVKTASQLLSLRLPKELPPRPSKMRKTNTIPAATWLP